MVSLGDAIRFTPTAFVGEAAGMAENQAYPVPREVTGRVIYINEAHRYYTVQYSVHDYTLRESFKF